MKKLYFLFAVILFFVSGKAQIINFPDANFKSKLLEANTSNTIARNLLGAYFKIDTNNDGEIQVSEAQQVKELDVNSGNITSLTGILNFTNMTRLNCHYNEITALDLNGLTNLLRLDCYVNNITNLDLSGVTNLEYVYCVNNGLTDLNISNLQHLYHLDCGGNQLTSLNLTSLPALRIFQSEFNNFTTLNFSGLTNLTRVLCSNTGISNIILTGATNLRTLECNYNNLTSINLNGLSNLSWFACNGNNIGSLNLTGLSSLGELQCVGCGLTQLDLSACPSLGNLYCGSNALTSLNVGVTPNLRWLNFDGNQIASIDLSTLTALQFLIADNNLLTSLDANNSPNLIYFFCRNNPNLTSIFLKNGIVELELIAADFILGCPNLEYICADESQLNDIQGLVTSLGYTNCSVNSYCSFSPGGVSYKIQGTNTYDSDSNGCDVLDTVKCKLLKFNISGVAGSGTIISDESGFYQINVNAGTHTIVPVLENTNCFSITPSQLVANFPLQASPLTQSFCITPIGVHHDVEISILPITAVRPGFAANYKILYRNKGNQTESGSIIFTFDDALMDFTIASLGPASQTTNQLIWNFSDLLPFEDREIVVNFSLNSPTQIPPVNGGDILTYTTSINVSTSEEMLEDNIFVFQQTVVNSYDPNDKTCLEGNTITPEMVGKYVHYLIRFENTGTANAENIVVKDMIDTAKFDINSLIPIDGSHPFVTRISNTNKVEFIFENIQLPFDDANNDGYVAFKIKTKPSLVLGDSFSNTASIYFDYNFPIVTDPAVTTVALLANQDFEFENYFKIYPNPANAVLNIETKTAIEVTSIHVYNTLGQIVLVIPNAQQTKSVDVSSLKTGNYLVKVNSDKGSSSVKFVKM